MLNRFVLGLSCAMCSLPLFAEDVQSYIINGTATSTTEFPSYARLYHNEYKQFGYCGGTFIDATHVLTAAHCVEFTAGTQSETDLLFTVVIPGLDNQDTSSIANAEKHYVSKYYIHKDYNSPIDTHNDIAILELESAVNVSSYATFASSETDYRADGINETFVAVGHGRIDNSDGLAVQLQKATLTYVAQNTCNEYNIGQAPDSQLCMSGQTVGTLRKSTCSGDSGGPLYWTSGAGEQVGITSYGPKTCGNPAVTATSVFTEVADYKDWINNVKDGLISPSYTTSETSRQYYRDNNSLPATSSSGGGGGGAIPLWSVLFLFALFLFRREYNRP